MRVPVRTLTVATLAIFVSLMAVSPASAQAPAPLEGNVVASADRSPIEGAVVDIYRTDIKGKFNTKTDKKADEPNWAELRPQLIKLGLELGPLVVFFIANGRADIFAATAWFMGAMVVSLLLSWLLLKKVAV